MNQKDRLDSFKKDLDTLIIGSGVGGLSAALCLARAGQKVLIIEQHKLPGGWCQSFKLKGFRFSPGLHYIGSLNKGGALYNLYKGLGLANDLVFYRMKPSAYEHALIDGEQFDFPNDFNALVSSLSARFPNEKQGIRNYLELVRTIGREIQLFSNLNSLGTKLVNLWKVRHLLKYHSCTVKSVCDKFIKDPVLKKVINIQYGDHGLPPGKASFLIHCGIMDHYFHGGFYPEGGARAIVKTTLRAIKKYGGEIITGQRVKRILLDEHKKNTAIGVELANGEKIFAERVVSNADPEKTFLDMLGAENISQKLLDKLNKTNYSTSSLILFLAVDMDVRKAGLDTGNIWVMNGKKKDEDQLFDNLLQEDFDSDAGFPQLFVSCTTLKDPAHFDGKHHTLEVIAFSDYKRFKEFEHKRDSKEYLELKEKIMAKFITSLEEIIPGIGKNIVMKELGTPLSNEFYVNSTKGNIYGTEKSTRQVGLGAYQPTTEIKNLYLCGASVTAHGISGASYSGVDTAAKILKCKNTDLIQANTEQQINIIDLED